MLRTAVAVAVTALLVAGCAGTVDRAGAPAAPAAPATAGSAGPSGAADDPRVDTYLAVVRHYLGSGDHSISGTDFRHLFLLDRLDAAAATPTPGATGAPADAPFDSRQRERITAALGGGVRVTFVGGLDEATEPGASCPVVRDGGIYVAVAPARATGPATAEVAVHGFVACLGATWLTYTMSRGPDGWTVTGTTGPLVVA